MVHSYIDEAHGYPVNLLWNAYMSVDSSIFNRLYDSSLASRSVFASLLASHIPMSEHRDPRSVVTN